MKKNNHLVPYPRLIAFEITRRCRFNCRHCRAHASADQSENELTTNQCKKILASIADFKKCVIILTGGEPMERPDFFELTEYGRNLGLRMVMATCGYLINEESILRLKEAGVLSLSFSLDGADVQTHDSFRQTPGAFEIALKAAKIAREADMPFQINTTISKLNLSQLDRIAKLACEIGAVCFNPFILVPTGRGRQISDQIISPVEYEKLLNDLFDIKQTSPVNVRVTCGPQFARLARQKKAEFSAAVNGCMGGRGFGFVSYCGDVQTCGFLDISAGNLVENNFDFADIWLNSEFLNQIRRTSGYKANCGRCEFVNVCGGCRARAYAITGDYLQTDPVCDYRPKEKK